MKKGIVIFLILSLTGNVFPLFNVCAILGLFPLAFFWRRSTPASHATSPHGALLFLKAAYVFWIASYLLTQAPVQNLFSFEFLRFDGALLIAYLPLLLFSDCSLTPRFVQRAVTIFLTALSFEAVLGALEFAEANGMPLGLSHLPESLQFIHNAPLAEDIFHGLFRAHNAAGAVYALSASLALCLLLNSRESKLVSWPSFWLVACLTGLLLSQSRTAYVSFLVVFLIVFVTYSGDRKKLVKVSAWLILPLAYLLIVQPDIALRTAAVSDVEDSNVVERFIYYQRAIQDFTDSPIIGVGFGRFNDESRTYSGFRHWVYVATGGEVVNLDTHAHNSYLHFLAEGGIVGLTLMMGIWIATYRWAKALKSLFAPGSFGSAMAKAIQACVILEFLLSFTEHTMGTALSSLTVFTMVGLLRNLAAHEFRLGTVAQASPNGFSKGLAQPAATSFGTT